MVFGGGQFHPPPELDDVWVLLPPAVDHVLDFLVWQVFQRPAGVHPPHGPDPALVAQGQGGDLATLPVAVVGIPLDDGLHRDAEHLRCRCLVDSPGRAENVKHPFLARLPGNQPGLDGGEVGINEHRPRRRNQRRPDHLAEQVVDIAVDHL